MKKKLAVLTMHDVGNYGSSLQAYATQKVLENLGHDCMIIDYKYPNNWHYKHGYHRPALWRRIIGVIASFVGVHSKYRKLKTNTLTFCKKHLHLTKRVESYNKLKLVDWSDYDTIIAGSDQIWNPRFMKGDPAFLLDFVPDNIRKISVASSFACTKLPTEYEHTYKLLLSRFDAISVRDNNGIDVIKSLELPFQTKVILDPTLLLSAEEWKTFLKLPQVISPSHILVYNLRYAVKGEPYIYDVANEMYHRYQLPIMFIGEIDETEIKSRGLNDYKIIESASIEEFVGLFTLAKVVVTSSFHGTSFAVNFSRPLIAITPKTGDDRQRSLLRRLGIENCATVVDTDVKTLNPIYNIKIEQQNLCTIRKDNLLWIQASI